MRNTHLAQFGGRVRLENEITSAGWDGKAHCIKHAICGDPRCLGALLISLHDEIPKRFSL